MRRRAAALVLLLASCGKEPERDPLDSDAYRSWKGGQILRRLPAANFAPTAAGHIDVYPPEQRSKSPGDFVELYLNGERVGRTNVAKRPDGTFPQVAFDVTFTQGPNTFDLWDSTSNRYYRQQVDTREAVQFLCAPTADGYEIQIIKKKED